jgi:hypothetical protein
MRWLDGCFAIFGNEQIELNIFWWIFTTRQGKKKVQKYQNQIR